MKKKNATLLFTNGRFYFQASEYKGRNFLDLNDDNNQSIYPIYTRGSAWIKYFSLSNSICIHMTRLIMNHAPTGKYRLPFAYPCRDYPIERRRHILFECAQSKKSWNSKRKFLKDVLTFLEFNPRAFFFQEGII